MCTYTINPTQVRVGSDSGAIRPAVLLRCAFGTPAQNDVIIRDVTSRLMESQIATLCGDLVLVNGPASLPVACAIAHALAHRFGSLGVFDPKLDGYIVAISHDPDRVVGQIIPSRFVTE